MTSNENQKSRVSLFGLVATAATVGGAIALIETFKQKRNLEQKLQNNSAECEECFVNFENLEPEEGDLIEIQRDGYAHWALYVGNGYVIHLTQIGKGLAKVFKEELRHVVNKSLCRVNNLKIAAQRRGLIPKAVHDILEVAHHSSHGVGKYHLFHDNCEHFVTYCRFGEPFSEQGKAAKKYPIIKNVAPTFATSSFQYD